MWRLDDGVTMAGEIAVTLVVGDDDDDVWPISKKRKGEECEE